MRYYLEAIWKYASFTGRAARRAFWWFMLLHLSIIVALTAFEVWRGHPPDPMNPSLVLSAYQLFILLPLLALTVRRLHDTNRSGWWILLNLVPVIGQLLLLWFMLISGDRRDNRYGPDPLAAVRLNT